MRSGINLKSQTHSICISYAHYGGTSSYFKLNPQLEQALRFETGDNDHDSPDSRSLAQQNVDLRRRLDEEQAAYKRKLTAYQEGQQRQAQLVQKLQAKVGMLFSVFS